MDEAKLREKLARIEALFAGATTDGERVAAAEARKRIQLRLKTAEQREDAVVYRFSLGDAWARKVLIALLRRYDLKPYRHRGQRRSTVMVKVPPSFVKDTLWPEFQQISAAIRSYVEQVDGPEATARNRGAAAASAKLGAYAHGSTPAAVSLEGAATAVVPTDGATFDHLRRQLDDFNTSYRAAIENCLTELARREIAVSQIKETVDDIWTRMAAEELRKPSPMVGVAKDLLVEAAKLGAGGLLKLLPFPKVL